MPRRATSFDRVLDRVVGVPVLMAAGLRPKRALPDPASVRRVAVFKSAAIGDTLLLAGMFEALRAAYPAAAITLVTGPDNAAAAPYFAEVIDRHVVVAPRRPDRAIRVLRSLRLDMLLECGPWPRVDAIIGSLSGARYAVGFRVPGFARHFAFDRAVAHSADVHQMENFRALAEAAGATAFGDARLRVVGAPPAQQPPRPYVVFHPWSGGFMGYVKEWPNDQWVELAATLEGNQRPTIVISGGPGDAARSSELAAQIVGRGLKSRSVAGEYSLAELGHVLLGADAVVAVNTGVMHLAALLGARTVCLDGPTPALRWGPIGPRACSVASTFAGCGYLNLGFEYAGHRTDCMESITVSAVADAVRALGTTAPSQPPPASLASIGKSHE